MTSEELTEKRALRALAEQQALAEKRAQTPSRYKLPRPGDQKVPLTREAYEAEITRLGARYGLEMARQSVAAQYFTITPPTVEDEAEAPMSEAAARAWFEDHRAELARRVAPEPVVSPWLDEEAEARPQAPTEAEAQAPKPQPARGTLRPMNHTLRNQMPGRAREAFVLFERWADPDGRFFCSPAKLAVLVTGRASANKQTGVRLLSLHRAAGVITREKRGRGAQANRYRLVRLIDHELAARVYREYRAGARERMRALGFERVD
jgi:hypothetical protein